jgi:hypothetical protein
MLRLPITHLTKERIKMHATVLFSSILLANCGPKPDAVDIEAVKPAESTSASVLKDFGPAENTARPFIDKDKVSLLNVGNRFTNWADRDKYLGQIQPILAKRCVVCHGCTDAPCQLKLNSYADLIDGASPVSYYATRIWNAGYPGSRKNAKTFHSVIGNNLNDSILYKFIQLGMKNTTAEDAKGAFDLESLRDYQHKLDKTAKFQCVASTNAFELFRQKHPMAGMPFGLPRLSYQEFATLQTWISEGANEPDSSILAELNAPSNPKVIHNWENFFNQQSLKAQLLGRYLYEHLFTAHIHFDEMPGEFFVLVRSKTAPATNPNESAPIDEIITELPTDTPQTPAFFYRLKKVTEVITQKNHIVWQVNQNTLKRLDKQFMQTKWNVKDDEIVLPDYSSSNPFQVFAQIPATIRHRFMLENSKYFVESMVRGAVCVGRGATYAIADHFWVFFLKPESDVSSAAPFYRLGKGAMEALALDTKSITLAMQIKTRFDNNKRYLEGYEKALRLDLAKQVEAGLRKVAGLGLDDIWDGGGTNRNAWLTVIRHDASTTVHYGQEGGFPQSLWVMTYANFERLYYNLVVNFKYWGGLNHKLGTWRSMSHERLDGEDMFLSFLPEQARLTIREEYSGGLKLPAQMITGLIGNVLTGKKIKRYIDLYPLLNQGRPALTKLSGKDRADLEFARLVQKRMSKTIRGHDDILNSRLSDNQNIYNPTRQPTVKIGPIKTIADWEKYVRMVTVDRGKGRYAPYLPSITYVRVGHKGHYALYTLISNRGYLSHHSPLSEELTRAPERDTISVYRGAIGDYPELFLDIELAKAQDFLQRVQNLNQNNYQEELRNLKEDYAIRRNSAAFWPFVDWLHEKLAQTGEGYITSGILDLSKYDLYDRN